MLIAKLQTYGDTIHSFIQNLGYTGPFLPGFMPLDSDPINNSLPPVSFVRIDHVVGN